MPAAHTTPPDLPRRHAAFLIGPTAVGKSALALRVCERFGAELLSLDSMQVYRGMDVGTAKPSAREQARVPHHLIDLVDPSERYDLQRFVADFEAAEKDCEARGVRALAVGGTGLYLQALTRGLFDGPEPDMRLRDELKRRVAQEGAPAVHASLARVDPDGARRIHPHDEKRIVRALEVWRQTGRPISAWQVEWKRDPECFAPIVGLSMPVEELDERIASRTLAMLDGGWVEEALAIRGGGGFGPTAVQALGYAEVLAHAAGELDRAQTAERIRLRTRQFARRQRTWFRRFPEVTWIPTDQALGDDATGALGNVLGWG